MDQIIVVLIGAAMLLGLIGTLLPIVPGLPIIWGASLAYGISERFSGRSWIFFSLITILVAIGMIVGLIVPHRRVFTTGVPRSTVWFGILIGVIGFFLVPIVGLPLGAVIGVMLAEKRRGRSWEESWASTKALLIGFGIGALVEFGAGLLSVMLWVAWLVL